MHVFKVTFTDIIKRVKNGGGGGVEGGRNGYSSPIVALFSVDGKTNCSLKKSYEETGLYEINIDNRLLTSLTLDPLPNHPITSRYSSVGRA